MSILDAPTRVVSTVPKNLFVLANVIPGFEVNINTQSVIARADDAVSGWIAISPGVTYTISGMPPAGATISRNVLVTQSDKTTVTLLTSMPNGSRQLTFTAPANSAFITFSLNGRINPYLSTLSYAGISLIAGLFPDTGVDSVSVNGINVIQTVGQNKNLFNKYAVIPGYEVNVNGTIVARPTDDSVTPYIPIQPSKSYTISGLSPGIGAKNIAQYDSNGVYIAATEVGITNTLTKYTFTSNASAAFIRFSLQGRTTYIWSLEGIQVEQNSAATAFIPFSPYISALNGIQIQQPVKTTASKKILIFGDSISETITNVPTFRLNWPAYLGNLDLGGIANYSRSGAAWHDFAGNTDPRQHVSQQIADAITAAETPDIILFNLGTNDGIANLGDYTSAMAVSAIGSLDRVNSLYQAIRYAMWSVATQWPSAKVFACTPLQRASVDMADVQTMYDAIKQMCGRYGAQIIDQTQEAGIIRDFEALTATATATVSGGVITGYTVTNGGLQVNTVPTVTLTGGGGSGGVATAVISGGVVTSITVTNGGSGYATPPTVTLSNTGRDLQDGLHPLASGQQKQANLIMAKLRTALP